MSESVVEKQQNVVNSNRMSVVGSKTRFHNKDNNLRHRMSDQKWRQNLSKGFAALKTIIKQNTKQSVEQLMTAEGTKEVPLNKKPSMANKRLSRIQTLKSTIDLIKTRESVIENMINERQLELSAKNESLKTDKQSIAPNGLQKIKDIFGLFEKRHEFETNEKIKEKIKAMKVENTIADKKKEISMSSVKDNHCLVTSKAKTMDPILAIVSPIKAEVFTERFDPEFDIKPILELKSIEGAVDWKTLTSIKTEYDSDIDVNNNYTTYVPMKECDHSLHTFRDCTPIFESLSSLDNKSFVDYSYSYGPNDYLTTDLTEHLAITMPLTSFGSSLNYLNDSYV